MTTPRLIKPAGQQPATLADIQVATLRTINDERRADGLPPAPDIELDDMPTAKPVPMLRGTRDYGMVLHQIRALTTFACFLLACCVLLLASLAIDVRAQRDSGGAGLAPVQGQTALQLYIPGPDPAVDYYAHVTYEDGTERDVQVGAYLTDRPVRVEFAVTAPEGAETACRIALDGVRVAEETAFDGRTATCRWSAP